MTPSASLRASSLSIFPPYHTGKQNQKSAPKPAQRAVLSELSFRRLSTAPAQAVDSGRSNAVDPRFRGGDT